MLEAVPHSWEASVPLRWFRDALPCSHRRSDARGGGQSGHHFCCSLFALSHVFQILTPTFPGVCMCVECFIRALVIVFSVFFFLLLQESIGWVSALRHRVKGRVLRFSTTAGGLRSGLRYHGSVHLPPALLCSPCCTVLYMPQITQADHWRVTLNQKIPRWRAYIPAQSCVRLPALVPLCWVHCKKSHLFHQ